MVKWHKASLAAAVLLAGVGPFYYAVVLPGSEQARQDQENAARRADGLLVAQGRSAVVDCQEAAQMLYDVHWAAACTAEAGRAPAGAADDSADCDLPNAKAAVVNAWLREAEAQCNLKKN